MTKDKMVKLLKYQQDLKNKLDSNTPVKHVNHPESYKQYLLNELSLVSSTINAAKTEAMAVGAK